MQQQDQSQRNKVVLLVRREWDCNHGLGKKNNNDKSYGEMAGSCRHLDITGSSGFVLLAAEWNTKCVPINYTDQSTIAHQNFLWDTEYWTTSFPGTVTWGHSDTGWSLDTAGHCSQDKAGSQMGKTAVRAVVVRPGRGHCLGTGDLDLVRMGKAQVGSQGRAVAGRPLLGRGKAAEVHDEHLHRMVSELA